MRKLRKRGYKWDQDIDFLVNAKGIVCGMFELHPIEYNKPKPAAFKAKKVSPKTSIGGNSGYLPFISELGTPIRK